MWVVCTATVNTLHTKKNCTLEQKVITMLQEKVIITCANENWKARVKLPFMIESQI
jgi:hypothetical protein